MPEHEIYIDEIQNRIPPSKRIKQLLHSTALAAGLMLLAAIVAIVIANTPLYDGFVAFWHMPIGIILGPYTAELSLGHAVNDVLMVLFFLLIGLEIKYEMTVGELKNIRQAILPTAAAIGGALVPIAIYAFFNAVNPETSRGWGIPTATDIAFALGIMALLSNRIPRGITVFLCTLAVADDIIAILIIAVYYGQSIDLLWLVLSAVVFAVLIVLNRKHVYSLAPYLIIGIVLWFCIFMSGVHSTIAGVLLAFVIPAGSRVRLRSFISWSDNMVKEANNHYVSSAPLLSQTDYISSVAQLSKVAKEVVPPLIRLRKRLHPWVYFLILPLFALANASVTFSASALETMFVSPVFYGVMLGLLLGKPIGILLVSVCLVKLKVVTLPKFVTWSHMIGASILSGVGFTMAIFVANLAFADESLISIAKAGILMASFIAATCGLIILYMSARKNKKCGIAYESENGTDTINS